MQSGEDAEMQFGFNMPTAGSLIDTASLCRLASESEAIGFDYATFSDHIVIPTDIHARYPYTSTGEFPGRAAGDRHEQLIEVAFLAAKTSRLRLVTSVMVVPHRPAVLTAKMLATIDVLSGGRLTLGIGAGWMKEEFEAIAAPDFAARGKVTDEYLQAFRELWTKDDPKFAGEHVKFSGISFAPKPAQRPGPPIWVGGESGPAIRRTARLGDAWYPIGTNPEFPFDSLKRLEAGIARLRKLAQEAGRDANAIGVAYRVQRYGEAVPAKAGDGEKHLFSGSDRDIVADLQAMRAAGVGHVDFSFAGTTADEMLRNMKQFHDAVLAKV
jgi:probable F420-dependent oxidoreductase